MKRPWEFESITPNSKGQITNSIYFFGPPQPDLKQTDGADRLRSPKKGNTHWLLFFPASSFVFSAAAKSPFFD
jgi:hypothetical protein